MTEFEKALLRLSTAWHALRIQLPEGHTLPTQNVTDAIDNLRKLSATKQKDEVEASAK